MSSIEIESRVLSSLLNGDTCWLCLEDLDSLVVDTYHPDHIVLPISRYRADACSHLLHQRCAVELIQHQSQFAVITWLDGTVNAAHITKCYCGVYSTQYVSADSSLGEI